MREDLLLLVDDAKASKINSLTSLLEQCDDAKLSAALTKVNETIRTSQEEGNFTCYIPNETLEDLFTAGSEEAFDDALVQAVVNILRIKGYKVKYEELIYSDFSNLLTISW